MPAQSEKQKIAARIARGVQKGEVKAKPGSASAQMAKMSPKSLKHYMESKKTNMPGIMFGYGFKKPD